MANVHRLRQTLNSNPSLEQTFPVDSAQVIEIGDLLWLNTDDVRAASQFTWDTDLGTTQPQFAIKFAGVAMQASASGETDPIRVAMMPIAEFPCASATFEIGDLVGPDDNATPDALTSQQVIAVTTPEKAIGTVVKRVGTAATMVTVMLWSSLLPMHPLLTRAIGQTDALSFIPTAAVTQESGVGLLAAAAATVGVAQLSNKNMIVQWQDSVSTAVHVQAQVPHDFDTTDDTMALHLLAVCAGTTDNVVITPEIFIVQAGAAVSADLAVSAATITQGTSGTPEDIEYDLSGNSIAQGDILDIVLTPGTHTTDDIELHGAYLKYTKE